MKATSLSSNTPAQTKIERSILSVVTGLLFFVLAILSISIIFQILYLGRIYPGTTISGIDVGGLSPAEAASRVTEAATFPQAGKIVLNSPSQHWVVSPAELGLFLNPESSSQKAFENGRSGGLFQRISQQFNSWYYHSDVPIEMIFDERMAFNYLTSLSQQINTPVQEPTISIEGTDVTIHPGQVGVTVNIGATIDLLAAQMRSQQDGIVPLVIETTQPKIRNADEQAALAKQILSQPLTLTMPEGQPNQLGPWTFQPSELAGMLNFQPAQSNGETYYEVNINSKKLSSFLQKIAPDLQLTQENPRFIFNDESRQLDLLQAAIVGRELNVQKSVESIQQQILEGNHTIPLEFDFSQPPVGDSTAAADLGITELIHTETSYFYGSSSARVQNITAAASRFHGLLVAPGETFSMVKALGDISLDNGYAEALIIYGNQTIQGVGGGVCQVSTTLFRAAFFTGFPIVERNAHAYRVSYYEKDAANRIDPRLAGLDATVYAPVIDLKFTNDTPYWLLMETYVNPTYQSIVWKFYSTSDSRTMDWTTTGPTNIVEAPDPVYRENDELAQGEVKQVDWAADGADITVNRTVYRAGEIINQDTFYTHYQPWQAIFEYGPGTEGMPPEKNQDEEN